MTLIITLFAALTVTILWYSCPKTDSLKIVNLLFIYWGASIMWMVDFVAELITEGTDVFNFTTSELINDSVLGLISVVLGLLIWVIYILIKDPMSRISSFFTKNKNAKGSK